MKLKSELEKQLADAQKTREKWGKIISHLNTAAKDIASQKESAEKVLLRTENEITQLTEQLKDVA